MLTFGVMKEKEQSLFTKEVIDFARVGVDYASIVEHAQEMQYHDFIDRMSKLLPLLYLQTKLLPPFGYDEDTDYAPVFVTEDSYDSVRSSVETLLAGNDTFLTTQHEGMKYSDTPIGASIAECLADVYQQVGDLLGTIREEDELVLPAAVGRCVFYFNEYWGRRLLSALGAIHALCCNPDSDPAYDPDSIDCDDIHDCSDECHCHHHDHDDCECGGTCHCHDDYDDDSCCSGRSECHTHD